MKARTHDVICSKNSYWQLVSFKSKIAFTGCDFCPANFGAKFVPRFHDREKGKQFEKASKMASIVCRELSDEANSPSVICSNNL